MTTIGTNGWVRPTLTVCGLWFVLTVLTVAFQQVTHAALPGAVVKVVPFLVSGLFTSRLVAVSTWRSRLIASTVLALVSTVAWTSFSVVTRSIPPPRALALLGASLPVFLVASAWACLGMYLGGRTSAPTAPETDPELDAIEREIREEMALRGREHPSEHPSSPASGSSRGHSDDAPAAERRPEGMTGLRD